MAYFSESYKNSPGGRGTFVVTPQAAGGAAAVFQGHAPTPEEEGGERRRRKEKGKRLNFPAPGVSHPHGPSSLPG